MAMTSTNSSHGALHELLLPCPFCGGDHCFIEPDKIAQDGEWVLPIHVGCKTCQARLTGRYMDEAIEAWNRRAFRARSRVNADDRHDNEQLKN